MTPGGDSHITYKSGYRHQINLPRRFHLLFKPIETVRNDWIEFDKYGMLTIRAGYAWDGPSGPAIATRSFMRGSLVHDALYQLIRESPGCISRELADQELRRICIEDGMFRVRAWWVYRAVRIGGKRAASKRGIRKTRRAP